MPSNGTTLLVHKNCGWVGTSYEEIWARGRMHVGQLLDLGALRALKAESGKKIIPQNIPHDSLIIPVCKRQKWIDMVDISV